MPLRSLLAFISLFLLTATGMATAADKPPKAPSDLKVTAVGVNTFKLTWKDNSDNETGWEVKSSLKGGAPLHFTFIPGKDITSYTVVTNDLPGSALVFQVAAYSGAVGSEVISAPTSIVAVKALSPKTFDKPTDLTAETLDDGRVRLKWTDNSTSEWNYQVETKLSNASDKKWAVLGVLGADVKFNVIASNLLPSKSYVFRVRAFRGVIGSPGTTKHTGYSNVAGATTKAFIAPDKLEATAGAEASFTFKWKDRSGAEDGYELQQKTAGGEFKGVWTFGANANQTELLKNFPLDQELQFRIRSYRKVGTDPKDYIYSDFSNVVTIRSTVLAKPTEFVVAARTDSTLKIKWKDNSLRETNYQIEARKSGTSSYTAKFSNKDVDSFVIAGLEADQQYDIRIYAIVYNPFGETVYSASSGMIQGRTRDGVGGDLSPLLSVGMPFSYQIQITDTSLLTGVTVTGLPDGLTYDPATRTISGMVDHDGTFEVTVKATFSDGRTSTRTVNVRTIAAPVVVTAFSAKTLAVGGSTVVSVAGKFSDPDTASAARFETTKGTFDIIFFPGAAPGTVDNFIDYMDAGKYDNMFFHRSPASIPVVQGGGFSHTTAQGFTQIETFPAITNEPGISNRKGTVAMARVGGFPDSATSQWFVNTADNSSQLDSVDGGFTVFGRVPAVSMSVVEQIRALPVGNYQAQTGFSAINELPVNAATAPATLDPAQLVKVISCGPAPILTYQVSSLQPTIATATLSGTDITITGVAAGTATIEIKAKDLDANTVTVTFTVTVS